MVDFPSPGSAQENVGWRKWIRGSLSKCLDFVMWIQTAPEFSESKFFCVSVWAWSEAIKQENRLHFQTLILSVLPVFPYYKICIMGGKHWADMQCTVCLVAGCAGQVLSASCHCSDCDGHISSGYINRKHPGTLWALTGKPQRTRAKKILTVKCVFC